MSTLIAVHVNGKVRTNWQSITPPIRKPSNWKQETFEAKLPELIAEFERTADSHIIAGLADSVDVFDAAGGHTFSPADFIAYVDEALRVGGGRVHIVGDRVTDAMRQVGWTIMLDGGRAASFLWNVDPRVTLSNLTTLLGTTSIDMDVQQILKLTESKGSCTAESIYDLLQHMGLQP